MSDLKSRIAHLIAVQGPLSIAQFMTIALHDPKEGYYATRDPLGARGDFITAPEVSQMFGEMLGLWCAQVWHDQGAPKRVRLVELGPGRGTLMEDALRALRVVPDFLEAIEVVLVEASPVLRALQAEKFKTAGVAIRGVTHFNDTLIDRPLFVLANEFFDALPIHQFVKTERGWCERVVTADEKNELKFVLAPVPAQGLVNTEAELGAVLETSPAGVALAEEIGRVIATQGGAALFVDYGHAGGFGDTLQAVAKHKYANVLEHPGAADLSAHVDFAALSDAARLGGAKAFGPVEQGKFLTALGIAERAQKLGPQTNTQLERLVSPDQMGTLFKALAIMPNGTSKPPGF